jgi:hypothetical protein
LYHSRARGKRGAKRGRGFAAGCVRLSAAGCVEGLYKKVLKMDRPFGRIIKEAPEAPYLANAVVLYNSLGRQALSYLRRPMTKQCIKILIKGNSMN